MTSADSAFAGSIPALYDRYMVPLLFEPYARDLAGRVAALHPDDILETAAGTGVVTAAMARALPDARILATDLNAPMLEVAAARIASPNVLFQPADAQALPLADDSMDALVCQFGVMFFPDRVGAYREARRVLRPGGRFLFNVWDRIERNDLSHVLTEAVAALFPDNAPAFLKRVPFAYHDRERIVQDLRAAGFGAIDVETVEKRSRLGSAAEAAMAMCQGSPLRNEIEAHGPDALERATKAAAAALARFETAEGLDAAMSAHVFSAAA